MLRQHFISLLKSYTADNDLINTLWEEIEKNYTEKKRHYHTIEHLENLLRQLDLIRDEIQDWDAILFTLFYHDVVYNVFKSDNEEQSAILAEKRMQRLGVPTDRIDRCRAQILATKSHQVSPDSDTNYFTDADLSALGMPWNEYSMYYLGVRKEYSIYPDFIYNRGRKKVLNHFLSMDRLFKTDYFHEKYEEQAKQNIKHEIELLS
jgi:predicted metal-dependent HD superfamily phosphohydrolase